MLKVMDMFPLLAVVKLFFAGAAHGKGMARQIVDMASLMEGPDTRLGITTILGCCSYAAISSGRHRAAGQHLGPTLLVGAAIHRNTRLALVPRAAPSAS